MILLALTLFAQSHGDTLRWYDTTTAGWNGIGIGGNFYMNWAIIWPVDSSLDGRTIHSGRVYIWEPRPVGPGMLKLCTGTLDSPTVVLDSGGFYSSGQGFYEIFFGDTIALREGDLIWLWCNLFMSLDKCPAGVDSGPAIIPYGDQISADGGKSWNNLTDLGLNYNWVMELILTPLDVEEGPAKPEERLTLLPAPGGFWITGYEGPAHIYDPTGRLVLKREIKGKALVSPLRPGVYFVVAGRQRGRVAVQ